MQKQAARNKERTAWNLQAAHSEPMPQMPMQGSPWPQYSFEKASHFKFCICHKTTQGARTWRCMAQSDWIRRGALSTRKGNSWNETSELRLRRLKKHNRKLKFTFKFHFWVLLKLKEFTRRRLNRLTLKGRNLHDGHILQRTCPWTTAFNIKQQATNKTQEATTNNDTTRLEFIGTARLVAVPWRFWFCEVHLGAVFQGFFSTFFTFPWICL